MKMYYLAYGSNLNVQQMRYRCPGAKPIGIAEIPDYELLFKGSKTGSYLTIEKHKGSYVPVVVWEINEANEHNLDIYEGYPSFYYKKAFKVKCHRFNDSNTILLNTFAYIMHEERLCGVPSPHYVATCLDGYQSFGFDSAVLFGAYLKSEELCNTANQSDIADY